MKQGVPQGGVLSSFLFNLYIRSLPSPSEDVKIITYADEITITTSGPDVKKMAVNVTEHLKKFSEWLKSRKLVLSAEKSTTTIFTNWSKEVGFVPEVYVNVEKIPLIKTPKVLGAVFDNVLRFTQHVKKVCKKNPEMKQCPEEAGWY